MNAPHLPDDLPERLAASREDLRRRSRAERVHPVWLWLGIVTGPIAFVVVRTASVALVSHNCGTGGVLGLTSSRAVTTGITLVAALLTLAAGLLSWRIWRRTSLPEDEVSSSEMPRVPFWAMGGVILSAFFFFFILYTGALAVLLGGSCP